MDENKNSLRLLIKYLCVSSVCFFISCGMVKDESLDNSVYDLEALTPACPIDTQRLAKILDEDLKVEIDCLETNIFKFADFVKRNNQKEIRKEELAKFVNKFLSSDSDHVALYLDLVFKVNSLALKQRPDVMDVNRISDFIMLLRHTNTYGKEIKKDLDLLNGENYLQIREQLNNSFKAFSDALLKTISVDAPTSFQVNLLDLATEIKEAGEIHEEDLDIKTIEELLFLKRIILGGKHDEMDTRGFEELIKIAPTLASIYFDIVEVNKRSFIKKSKYYRFLLSALLDLKKIILEKGEEEVYFFDTNLIDTLTVFFGGKDWRKVGVSFQVFKADIIGGDANFYDKEDIQKIFTYGTEIIESLFFSAHTYEALEEILEKEEAITKLDFPDSSDYSIVNQERIPALWADFQELAYNQRTFAGENKLIKFNYRYKRSRWGFLLFTLLNYAGDMLYDVYHTGIDPEGNQTIDKEQIRNIVLDYQDALKEFELWPKDLERLVSELLTGSDVFQFTSNGDLLLQKSELVQYLPTVIAANSIGKDLYERLEVYCLPDPNLHYEVQCYRDNFFPILFFDFDLIENYPNFFKYYSEVPWERTQKYLQDAEQMARIDADPKVPVTKVDLSRLVTSMSNAEVLFLKFDENESGILDPNELDKIFKVLKQTLAVEAKLKPTSKLLKSVFLYIVKKQKEPSAGALLWFHVFGKKKNITADRNTIAGVLRMFGNKKK